ncbi:MAG: replication-relaxation family protein [Niallia sp.]
MMKEQRIENILLSLKKMDYLTQKQIQRIHGLGGERNANRILWESRDFLSNFRNGLEKVYYLNKLGRMRVDCEIVRSKTMNIEHFLLRNQLWIHLKMPHTWTNEVKIIVGDTSIVCDAKYLASDKTPVFVEVDVAQPMVKNIKKIHKYKRFKELTNQKFHVLWVTQLESRRSKLKEMSNGLSSAVYTANDIM